MKALVVGANGLVGRICVEYLLKDDFYEQVEIWVRRTTGINNPKLIEKITDYSNLSQIEFSGIDHVYCCLGTTIKKAGSQTEFRKVDYEYVLAVAKIAEQANSEKFIVISSIGANKDSANFYLRTKGEMEKDVKKLLIPAIYIVRPSFIMGEREEFRLGEKAGLFIIKGVNFLLTGKLKKYRGIEATTIAKAMIYLAIKGEQKKMVFESDKLQELGNY